MGIARYWARLNRSERRFLSAFIAHLLAFFMFVAAALFSGAATVPPATVPRAAEVRQGQLLIERLQAIVASNGRPNRLIVTQAEARGLLALVGNGYGVSRLKLRPESGKWTVEATLTPVPDSYVNIAASIAVDARGQQRFGRIGYLPLPPAAVDALMRTASRMSDPPLADPDQLFNVLWLSPGKLIAMAAVPRSTMRSLQSLSGVNSEELLDAAYLRQMARILCKLEESRPSRTLDALYRRAAVVVAEPPGTFANRYVLTAVAMLVAKPDIARLAAGDVEALEPCIRKARPVTLIGREDLAKHFSLSAALAASTDPQMTLALGEWKELDDSLPGGSGFSFIDLAADRAGQRLGENAIRPDRAKSIGQGLERARERELLPRAALKYREGMSKSYFEQHYGATSDARFQLIRTEIDVMLDPSPLLLR